jgi:Zn-dependent M28 family amino/carboxypeptidase
VKILRRRRSLTALVAVAMTGTALAGTGGGAPAMAATSALHQQAVPANHGIPDLIAMVEDLRDDGSIPGHVAASLLDRLQRALAQEQTGSEVRTVGLLQQFVARAENQIKGDAADVETRDMLVEAAVHIIDWLTLEEESEVSGSAQLQADVTLDGVMRHLRAFQQIADANDGNRASGLGGHEDSAEYVHDLLADAGYSVSYQSFDYRLFEIDAPTVFQQISPDAVTYTEPAHYNTASYSGEGDVTGVVVPVDVTEPPGPAANSNSSGCEAADFAGFPAGAIALLQRGTCSFGQKAQMADEAGAAGVILYNEGTPGVPDRNDTLNPTLGEFIVGIPVIGVDYTLGRDLATPAGTVVRIKTDVTTTPLSTRSVIADHPDGSPDNVVMLGGHLDSVPEGPGINDNGTGTAALLETALQMADDDLNNKVRFAFWAAEEASLLGSNYYVAQISDEEFGKIAMYLNFDMVGSPNYFRGVYDGTGDLGGTAPRPEGSAAIETLFNTHFGFKGLPYEDTEFSGRSDYQAFINNGIPAGGLFTGAEGDKTAEQVERYGGILADYDPCYHQACDSFTPLEDGADAATYAALQAAYGGQLVGNVNTYALDTSADAIAHAAATYAYSTASVNGVE